jgi:hypothetical protein
MHITFQADIVALDAQAVRASVDLVTQATAADLARPTPSTGTSRCRSSSAA